MVKHWDCYLTLFPLIGSTRERDRTAFTVCTVHIGVCLCLYDSVPKKYMICTYICLHTYTHLFSYDRLKYTSDQTAPFPIGWTSSRLIWLVELDHVTYCFLLISWILLCDNFWQHLIDWAGGTRYTWFCPPLFWLVGLGHVTQLDLSWLVGQEHVWWLWEPGAVGWHLHCLGVHY
jgi:hypothetical protein